MESHDETNRVIRALVEKHLQSVVSIRAFKVLEPQQGGEGGGQDGEEQGAGKEEEKEKDSSKKEGPETVVCYGTGSIIHCCDRFALVLSCSHIFQPFRVASGDANQPGESQIEEDTQLMLDFFDGHSAPGHFAALDWERDLSLIMVFTGDESTRGYRAVKFADHSYNAMGFSAHERETPLYTICTFPAEQRRALFGTGLAGKICAPPRLGNDIDRAFDPELKIFQFLMEGADGCSGAPLFTATRQVMGIWISHVGEFKFGILLDSICEWLQKTFNFQETSMRLVVTRLVSLYTEKLRLVEP